MATITINSALSSSPTEIGVALTDQFQPTSNSKEQFQTALSIATNTFLNQSLPNEPTNLTGEIAISDPTAEITSSDLLTQFATLSALAQFAPPRTPLANGLSGSNDNTPSLMQLTISQNPNQQAGLGTIGSAESLSRAELLRIQQPTQLLEMAQPRDSVQLRIGPNTNEPVEPVAALRVALISDSTQTLGSENLSVVNPVNRGSVIPAQIPLISGLLGNAQTSAQFTANPNPTAPILTNSAAGLPGTQVGDRPLMAGEKYAAIAVAGIRLATMTRVSDGKFSRMVENVNHLADRQLTDNLMVGTNFVTAANATNASPLTSTVLSGTQKVSGSTTIPNVSQLADDIVTQARLLQRADRIEFQLQLDPPDLGRVRVHLISTGDEIRGQVIVADDAVRRMIENQLPELRSRFETGGMNIQHFDVTAERNQSNGNTADLPDDTARNAIQTPMALQNRSSSMVRSSSSSIDVTV